MNIAVIGCGYWGNHLLRNFNQSDKWNLVLACDKDDNNLKKVANMYPNIEVTNSYKDIVSRSEIDAVAIATPVFSHYEIAKDCLNAEIHTWLEKPLTSDYTQALELINIAKDKNVLLHVDHTYIYTPAVQKIKQIIQSGELGEINYIDSTRVNLGLFQHDINVIWDLAPHDISILQYCLDKKPVAVNATGKAILQYGKEDIESIAYLTVHFEDNTIAHFHVNWMSPVKIRQIIIAGTKKMLVFNDMEQSEKIKIYDSGVNIENKEDIYNTLIQYRTGDMLSPFISNKEALKEEVEHFFDSIISKKDTITSGESGAYVVRILEAANKSLKSNGTLITL